MSDTVNTTATVKFQNNVEMQLQQTKSQLIDAVETQDASGEAVTVKDLIGNAMPQEADERHGDLKQTNTPHDRSWLTKPNEQYFNEYVDGADQLATEIDLTGGYTMAAMALINRVWDSQILKGVYGPIITGKERQTSTPFPGAQIVPVGTGAAAGAARMNVAKLRAAKVILGQNFNEATDKRYMVLSEVQADDLLSEAQATSGDFEKAFGVRTDGEGNLTAMLGFNFLRMELRNPFLPVFTKDGLTVDANGYTKNPFWAKSGVRLGIWRKLRTAIKDQPSKVDTKSVFAGTTVAATRTQAGKVGIILNSEA